MRSSQRVLTAFWLLLALGLMGQAGAQGKAATGKGKSPAAAAPADPGAFIETVNVSVVNVDVYVTDKKGNPVNGLTKNDFQLFENGRPLEITNFYAVNNGKATTPAAELAAQPAPAAPVPGVPPQDLEKVQTPEDQRLRLIVYIHNYNLTPVNRNRVMRELRT